MSKPKTTNTTKAEAAQQPVVDAVEQKEASALEQQAQAATEIAAKDVQEQLPPGDDGSNKAVYEAVCAVHGPGCASPSCPQKAMIRKADGVLEDASIHAHVIAAGDHGKHTQALTNEPLDAYIARVERAKLDQDVVAVAITHPEVHADRVHPGTYGGIRLGNGPVGVTYSDGSKA